MEQFDFQIDDNLDVTGDYQGSGGGTPKPPLPGNYMFKPAKWQFRKTKDGQLLLYKDKQGNPRYPVISLTTVEITDPMDAARTVVLFQDVSSNPFEREGKMVSRVADLLKAINQEAVAANTGEVLQQLSDALNAGGEFRARLDYKAYDKSFAQEQVANLPSGHTKEQKNECYRKAEIRGYKKIRAANAANGRPELGISRWLGPSGMVVDVQPELTVFFGGGDSVTLGPNKDVQ